MDAVEVDARREDVRVAPETEGGEIAAVRRAPDSYVPRIDVGPPLQEQAGGEHVSIFACPTRSRFFCELKWRAVAHAEPVVHRQDDEAVRREVLIDGVVVRVLPTVVP